jgi:hypothetical protein
MKLENLKYYSMVILPGSTLIMTLIGICLQRFVFQRRGNVLSFAQSIISCITSGILLGKLIIFYLNFYYFVSNRYPFNVNTS